MNREVIKAAVKCLMVGIGFIAAEEIIADLYNTRVINPKTKQGDMNIASLTGALGGIGGTIGGIGLGALISEAFKEVN